jgi:hypothetical protein
MEPLACPHCGKPAISTTQKFTLGPMRSVACKSCGQRVSVPMTSMYTTSIPIILAIPVAYYFEASRPGWYGLFLVGLAVSAYLQYAHVSLERR